MTGLGAVVLYSLITIGLGCIPREYPTQTAGQLSTNKFWKCGVRNKQPYNFAKSSSRVLTRIVGGTDATVREWPWQVGLASTKGGFLNCGGSIISSKTILTAAHCLPDNPKWVLVGAHDRRGIWDGYWIEITDNPEGHNNYFRGTYDYDYAILTLSKELSFTFEIAPICLPTTAGQGTYYENKNSLHTGWGRLHATTTSTTYTLGPVSNTLQKVTVKSMTNQACCNQPPPNWYSCRQITDRMICASSPGKDTCRGDSGGPMSVYHLHTSSYTISGISSFSSNQGCAVKNIPGVYARVTNQLDWIKERTQGLVPSNPTNTFPEFCRRRCNGECTMTFFSSQSIYIHYQSLRMKYFRGSVYYFHDVSKPMSWKEGDSICKEMFHSQKGELASIHSKDEYDFFVGIMKSKKWESLQIGGKLSSDKKKWIWTDGTPMDYDNVIKPLWFPNQPSGRGEDAMQIHFDERYGNGYGLNDVNKDYKRGTFVCRLFCSS